MVVQGDSLKGLLSSFAVPIPGNWELEGQMDIGPALLSPHV